MISRQIEPRKIIDLVLISGYWQISPASLHHPQAPEETKQRDLSGVNQRRGSEDKGIFIDIWV